MVNSSCSNQRDQSLSFFYPFLQPPSLRTFMPNVCLHYFKHHHWCNLSSRDVLMFIVIIIFYLSVDYSDVDRFWNTKQQLSVTRETILSLSLPRFIPTRCDWSPTVVDESRDYVSALIGRRLNTSGSCAAQLSSRFVVGLW